MQALFQKMFPYGRKYAETKMIRILLIIRNLPFVGNIQAVKMLRLMSSELASNCYQHHKATAMEMTLVLVNLRENTQ